MKIRTLLKKIHSKKFYTFLVFGIVSILLFFILLTNNNDDAKQDNVCLNSPDLLYDTRWRTLPSAQNEMRLFLEKKRFKFVFPEVNQTELYGTWYSDFSDINSISLTLEFDDNSEDIKYLFKVINSASDDQLIDSQQFNLINSEENKLRVSFVKDFEEIQNTECPNMGVHINFGGIPLYNYQESFEGLKKLVTDCTTISNYIIEGTWQNTAYQIEFLEGGKGFIYYFSPPSEPILYSEIDWQQDDDETIFIKPINMSDLGQRFFSENNYLDGFKLEIKHKIDMPEQIGSGCNLQSFKLHFDQEELLPLYRINTDQE